MNVTWWHDRLWHATIIGVLFKSLNPSLNRTQLLFKAFICIDFHMNCSLLNAIFYDFWPQKYTRASKSLFPLWVLVACCLYAGFNSHSFKSHSWESEQIRWWSSTYDRDDRWVILVSLIRLWPLHLSLAMVIEEHNHVYIVSFDLI